MAYGIPQPELIGERLLSLVANLREHHSSYSEYQMAAAAGLPLEIYQGRMAVAQSERLKELPSWSLGEPLSITGDVMVIGDIHVPFTDLDFASLVGKVAKKHLKKPRQLVIAGDFFNADIFSDYYKLIRGPSWRDEKKAAIALAQEWAGIFDQMYYLSGNHDRRITRKTDGEMDIRDLADFLSVPYTKLQPSLFGFATLKSGGVDWRITHAKEYSINRLTVANELALKYQTNILSFHEHHLALGWDRFGRYVVVNGGCLVKQDELAYCTLDDTKRPRFSTGFVMIKDGCPTLFGCSPFTNWESWL